MLHARKLKAYYVTDEVDWEDFFRRPKMSFDRLLLTAHGLLNLSLGPATTFEPILQSGLSKA